MPTIDEMYNIVSEISDLNRINESLKKQIKINDKRINDLEELWSKYKPIIYIEEDD